MKLHVWGALAFALLSTAALASSEGKTISIPGLTGPAETAATPAAPDLPMPLPPVDLPGSSNAIPAATTSTVAAAPLPLAAEPPKPETKAADVPAAPALPGLPADAVIPNLPDIAGLGLNKPADTASVPDKPVTPHDESFPVTPEGQKPAMALMDNLLGKKPETKADDALPKADELAEPKLPDAEPKHDVKAEDKSDRKPEETASTDATKTAEDKTDGKKPAKGKKKYAARKGAVYMGSASGYHNQILPDTIYMRDYPRANRFLPKAQYEQEWDRLVFVTASQNNLNGMRALLETGRAPNLRDPMGQTPLIVAIRYKAMNTARLLLAKGADPNAMDNAGNSAMHYAVATNNYPMVRALIEMGGRYDVADGRGLTPQMMAEQSGNPLIKSAMGL